MNNEQIIRRTSGVAEKVDLMGWVDCFAPDGAFTDMVAAQQLAMDQPAEDDQRCPSQGSGFSTRNLI